MQLLSAKRVARTPVVYAVNLYFPLHPLEVVTQAPATTVEVESAAVGIASDAIDSVYSTKPCSSARTGQTHAIVAIAGLSELLIEPHGVQVMPISGSPQNPGGHGAGATIAWLGLDVGAAVGALSHERPSVRAQPCKETENKFAPAGSVAVIVPSTLN